MAVKIARPIDEVVDVPVMDDPLDVVSTEQAGDVVSEEVLQRAMDCEQVVLRIKRQTVINFVEMGRTLKEIRDKSYYKLLGYDDFEQWCESTEIDFTRYAPGRSGDRSPLLGRSSTRPPAGTAWPPGARPWPRRSWPAPNARIGRVR